MLELVHDHNCKMNVTCGKIAKVTTTLQNCVVKANVGYSISLVVEIMHINGS
jgi:hypothetical protein